MERLTKQVRGSAHYVPRECAECDYVADCGDCEYDVACIDRLASYEDSGLMPERVMEMSKAQEEGRLVVLPCKVGTTAYMLWRTKTGNDYIREFVLGNAKWDGEGSLKYKASTFDWFVSADEIGKTVFLTRAEVEAALAERQEGGAE